MRDFRQIPFHLLSEGTYLSPFQVVFQMLQGNSYLIKNRIASITKKKEKNNKEQQNIKLDFLYWKSMFHQEYTSFS